MSIAISSLAKKILPTTGSGNYDHQYKMVGVLRSKHRKIENTSTYIKGGTSPMVSKFTSQTINCFKIDGIIKVDGVTEGHI